MIDSRGCIQEDTLTEEGTVVKLTAVMSYEGEKASHEFYIKVFPPVLSSDEKLMKDVENSVIRADEETGTENYMVLPDQINGEVLRGITGQRPGQEQFLSSAWERRLCSLCQTDRGKRKKRNGRSVR